MTTSPEGIHGLSDHDWSRSAMEAAARTSGGGGPSSSAPHRVFGDLRVGVAYHTPGALKASCIRNAWGYDTSRCACRERVPFVWVCQRGFVPMPCLCRGSSSRAGLTIHPAPAPEHPIMKGLPVAWLHAHDELYSQLRGPAKNLTVLATASAKKSMRNGTGDNEPILMAITYGKGRVFHTTLGHVGPKDSEPVKSIGCVGFIVTLQRGTEWAAMGKVTQEIPEDFPTLDQTSVRTAPDIEQVRR